MRTILQDQYEELHRSDDFDTLRDHIQAIVQSLGFDGFLYLTVVGQVEPGLDPETFVLSSYHPDFVRQYQSRRCYRFDPAATYIRQH